MAEEKNLLVELRESAKSENVNSRVAAMLGEKDAALFINSVVSVATANLKEVETSTIWPCALKACALKLPIDPALGYAYLVPYNKKCTLQVGVRGLYTLAMRSNTLKSLVVSEVYEDELKRYIAPLGIIEFTEEPSKLRGKPTAEPIGYYASLEMKNGFSAFVYMTRVEMEAHRDRYSKMYKSNPKQSKWTDEFSKMAEKTILKKLLWKYGVLSVETESALAQAESEEENSVVSAVKENVVLDAEIVEKKAKGKKIELAEAVEADEKEKSEELEAFGEAL